MRKGLCQKGQNDWSALQSLRVKTKPGRNSLLGWLVDCDNVTCLVFENSHVVLVAARMSRLGSFIACELVLPSSGETRTGDST